MKFFPFATTAIIVSGLDKALPLFVVTLVIWFFVIYMFVRDACGEKVYITFILPVVVMVNRRWNIIRW